MKKVSLLKISALMVLVTVMVMFFSACAGVSRKDYEALQSQLNAKEQKLSAKEQEVARLKQNVVLSAVPDAPPRQLPPPPSPGTKPPPPPTLPAAKTVPIFFYVDTVTANGGESKYKVDANLGCVRTGAFKRGQRIVWRMEVIDTSTGKILQAADVKSAVLMFPHGENLAFRYSRHGAFQNSPWFWALGWDVPSDYPLGYIDYTIQVITNDGKVGTFKEMTVLPETAKETTEQRGGRVSVTSALMIVE